MDENKKILGICLALFLALVLCVGCANTAIATTNLTISSTEKTVNKDMQKLMKKDGYTNFLKWETKLVTTKANFVVTTKNYLKTWKPYLSAVQQKKLISNRNKVIKSHTLSTIKQYKNNSATIIKNAKAVKSARAGAIKTVQQYINSNQTRLTTEQQQVLNDYITKINNSFKVSTIKKYVAKAKTFVDNCVSIPGIDTSSWSYDKISYVREWGQRNNNYLAGYPMEGTGYIIAAAAYDNNVDPRHCAAVACLESGKGRACFRPYNAWGWMAATNWESWEQAINEYTAAFGSRYGYCFTYDSCLLYSGGNPDYYYLVQAQMDLI